MSGGINIRMPGINGGTEREQMVQMRSYLYQLAEQLNWAFEHVSAGGSSVEVVLNQQQQAAQHLDPNATFAAIKGLIIKSADIVNSYYDTISAKLNGLYVAKSDYGTFVEKTNAAIEANSKGIKQNYENQQTLNTSFTTGISAAKKSADDANGAANSAKSAAEAAAKNANTALNNQQTLRGDMESLGSSLEATDGKADQALTGANSAKEEAAAAKKTANDTAAGFAELESQAEDLAKQLDALNTIIITTNAYIKTGLLYEGADGIPVYGLEIGQTNTVNGQAVFSKFARFSADRLSFYDRNNTEVAYISDYTLYITNAEITGNLYILKRFRLFYGNGLAFQWIGGTKDG